LRVLKSLANQHCSSSQAVLTFSIYDTFVSLRLTMCNYLFGVFLSDLTTISSFSSF